MNFIFCSYIHRTAAARDNFLNTPGFKFTGITCISGVTDKGIYSMHLVSSYPFLYSYSADMVFIGQVIERTFTIQIFLSYFCSEISRPFRFYYLPCLLKGNHITFCGSCSVSCWIYLPILNSILKNFSFSS